ncbi:MAG: DUF6602 domain-containing protein [Chitinophagales bacterium]|jgi:hypothetical protein
MNPVLASLEENLRHIKLVAEPTVKGFTSDRENTGDSRELTVQQFLESYLTTDYQIKKGAIFSKTTTSKNIDCVVLFPNHPRLKTPAREVIIAEGVYAAVEVKPNIATLTSDSEFHRALLQIQSVKQIDRNRVIFDLAALRRSKESPYFNKIPGIIFSFKSQALNNITQYLQQLYSDGVIDPTEFPDIIITIDQGIVFYCPQIKETIFKPYLDHVAAEYPDKVLVEIHETETSQLVWFLRLFLALPKPAIALSTSILYQYLEIEGNANLKFYPLDKNESFIGKINS